MMKLPRLLLTVLLLVPPGAASGHTRQSAPDEPLFRTLAALDSALFESYNTCDLEKFGSFFAEDVEFYHDKGGVTLGRAALVEAIKKNICGKTRRELVAGSLEAHPMDGYGGVQIGVHRFCDVKATRCDPATSGIAKFIHLWRNDGGTWRITRVISYDHS